ncbi:MAG TPA: DNA polymerase III subunit alpha [Candidatus Latescibacteria bacterium]|nr:DNA polymerase III subunit alpha [Candidatus Latescibacterota bacterium]
MEFVHLHTHSYYSLLDGLNSPEALLTRAAELGMGTLALTDHGVLYGAVEFYKAARKAGIKPILGCEVYVAQKSRFDRPSNEKSYHLVLLVEDDRGYQNLLQLVTKASLEGYYYKPRVDKELLRKYSDGLIATTACVMGEVPRALLEQGEEAAERMVREYLEIFGEGKFFLELQHHPELPNQEPTNRGLLRLARKLGLPVVATQDVHYLRPEDAPVQDTLLCIQTQSTLDDPKRLTMLGVDYSMTSPGQMWEWFRDVPEALENTLRIAERCSVELPLERTLFPHFPTPEGLSPGEYLRWLCYEGMRRRYGLVRDGDRWEHTGEVPPEALPKSPEEIGERLEYELGVIERMGFETYFLIVWDFVRFAKERRIMVGPGRGSAAGSLVAYVLEITDIDPLKYELMFERFLNPDRVEEPDIDVDFDDEHRDEVIEYVAGKYGRENVAQVITFGTMAAKAAVRDVGRAMGLSYEQVDAIAKLIPDRIGITLEEALKEPELKRRYEEDKAVRGLLEIAMKLEGVVRHASVHACAVVISQEPLTRYTPLQYAPRGEKVVITQYSADSLKDLGLLKMDLLGLRNLTVIRKCVDMARKRYGVELDIHHLPLDDPQTYELFGRGETTGVFQFESEGMKRYLRELRPRNFEDLIAMVALYRPGPMQFIEEYIARHHGERPVTYEHPIMERALKGTYGIMVYQEQLMQVSRDMAGFTGGEADTLRKAVAKKIPELMALLKEKFLEGATRNGVPKDTAERIWVGWEEFGRYAFNKSHAAAYAFVAYQTAYLKAHYPKEFMAANLTSVMDNSDRVTVFIEECRRMGIRVLPPDVNESDITFTVVEEGIRFGLGAVKNVGAPAVHAILEARRESPFQSLYDFCERVDLKALNRRMLESLISAGAMDGLGGHRAQLLKALDGAIARAQVLRQERQRGQISLFEAGPALPEDRLPEVPQWSRSEALAKEKEVLGFYVSGHPLDPYREELEAFATPFENLEGLSQGSEVRIGGMVAAVRTIQDRSGRPMAFVTLEGLDGSVEVVVFWEAYERYRDLLSDNRAVLVMGRLSGNESGRAKVRVEEVLPLEEARERLVRALCIDLRGASEERLEHLRASLERHRGGCSLLLRVRTKWGDVFVRSRSLKVSPSPELLAELRREVGREAVRLM